VLFPFSHILDMYYPSLGSWGITPRLPSEDLSERERGPKAKNPTLDESM